MTGDNVFLSNKNGSVVKGTVLRFSKVERSRVADNQELNTLFEMYRKYNRNRGSNTIDGQALQKLFSDFSKAAGKDNILSPEEINKFIKDHNLTGKVSAKSVEEFFTKIGEASTVNIIHDAVTSIRSSSHIKDYIKGIPAKDIYKTLDTYKKDYNISLVQHIANKSYSFGFARNGYINALRDKIVETLGSNAEKFKQEFNTALKKMDLTILEESNAAELEAVIEKYRPKNIAATQKTSSASKTNPSAAKARTNYPHPRKKDAATLERENRQMIIKMMEKSDLCRTKDDKNRIVDRIMRYAKLNNPTDMVKEYAKSSDPRVKKAAQNLLNSTFLDYFPAFVASIIAQESQFRETDNAPKTGIFTDNGKGVMQLTSSVASDIAANPNNFDKNFIKRLSNYCNVKDSTSIKKAYSATTQKSVSLNYDVGTATLKNKLKTYFNRIKDSNKDSPYYKEYMKMHVDLTNPATIMEIVALEYNGNNDNKHDLKHDNSMSQVKYVYGRDVIERFRCYTPEGIEIRNYFDYNPKTKKFQTVKS